MDLAQANSHLGITVLSIFNPVIDWQPVKEWIPQGQKKQETEEKQPKAEEKAGIEDYQKAIIECLAEAGNIQDIGKRLAERYGGTAEAQRLKIKNILPKMVLNDKIAMQKCEFVKFVNNKAFVVKASKIYYRRGDIPSGLHNYIANLTADVVFQKGLIPKIMPVGIGTADIETDKIAFEIETGLKNDIADIKERITKYEREGKKTIIITPNNEVKDKYKKEYPHTQIYTVLELWGAEL